MPIWILPFSKLYFFISIQLSPATKKKVDQNDVDFQEIILKDTDSSATVAMWDSMVNTLEKGECVQITKCRVRLFNEEKRLTTTRSSQCEVCINQ